MKKQILMATLFSVLCVGAAFAKGAPVPDFKFTPEQWEQLKALKPAQRNMAVMHGMHQQIVKDKMAALSPEQRSEVEKFIKDDMEQRKSMNERLEKMTSEQKEAIKLQLPPQSRRYKALYKGRDCKMDKEHPMVGKPFNGKHPFQHGKHHQFPMPVED